MTRTARSLLFVPGDRPERFAKAAASGAHAVVLDLEDAVAPDRKSEARQSVCAWLSDGGRAWVRINASDTAWYGEDLAMLREFPGTGIMLPKADLDSVSVTATKLPRRPLIALVESVAGLMALPRSCATGAVARVAFGSIDFGVDSGIEDEGDAMTAVRTQIVLQSRAAGLPAPIDGVSVEFKDVERMRLDAIRSRQLGFGGKLCIHPLQVAAVNVAFEPDAQQLSWARRVIDAFDASGGAATTVNGKMIDLPVVARARRILADGPVQVAT